MRAACKVIQFPRMPGGQWFAVLHVQRDSDLLALKFIARGRSSGEALTAVLAHAVMRLGWDFRG